MHPKLTETHHLRKALFARGLRQGYLTVEDIEGSVPDGAMSPPERWLLYASLRAAQIDIRDGAARATEDEAPPAQH